MFFIFKLFFMIVGLFVLMTFITGLSLFMRVKSGLSNPFLRPGNTTPPPPPAGKGDIIEGEFRVLDAKER